MEKASRQGLQPKRQHRAQSITRGDEINSDIEAFPVTLLYAARAENLQNTVLDHQHDRLIKRLAVGIEREQPQIGIQAFHRRQSVTNRRSIRRYSVR